MLCKTNMHVLCCFCLWVLRGVCFPSLCGNMIVYRISVAVWESHSNCDLCGSWLICISCPANSLSGCPKPAVLFVPEVPKNSPKLLPTSLQCCISKWPEQHFLTQSRAQVPFVLVAQTRICGWPQSLSCTHWSRVHERVPLKRCAVNLTIPCALHSIACVLSLTESTGHGP